MKKTLVNKIIIPVVLGVSLLVGGGCVTPQGRQFSREMGYTAVETFVQESVAKEVWDSGQGNVGGNVTGIHGLTEARKIDNYNSEERAILNQVKNMPRVVCIGDYNNDGDIEWIYHNGKGQRYWAIKGFNNKAGIFDNKKSAEFFIPGFVYYDQNKNFFDVPKNTLIINHQK